MSWKVRVKTIDGEKLTFTNVERVENINGILVFTDSRTGKEKFFAIANCELEKEDQK